MSQPAAAAAEECGAVGSYPVGRRGKDFDYLRAQKVFFDLGDAHAHLFACERERNKDDAPAYARHAFAFHALGNYSRFADVTDFHPVILQYFRPYRQGLKGGFCFIKARR